MTAERLAACELIYVSRSELLPVEPEVPSADEAPEGDAHEGRFHSVLRIGEAGGRVLADGAEKAGGLAQRFGSRWKADMPQVQSISIDDAEGLRFSDGGPYPGVLYARDPAVPDLLHPISTFHQHVRAEKLSQLVRLLTALGASHVVVSVEGDSSSTFDVSVSGLLDVDRHLNHHDEILFEHALVPRTEPGIPKDLPWYDRDPVWQALAEARMHGGTECRLKMLASDDFGITADLGRKLKSLNFDLDIATEHQYRQSWIVSVEYGEAQRLP